MGKSKQLSQQGFQPNPVPDLLYGGQRIGHLKPVHKEQSLTTNIRLTSENYQQLFEVSPFPLIVYDRDTFQILAVNLQAEIIYGYTQAEFKTLSISDLQFGFNLGSLSDLSLIQNYDVNSSFLHKTKTGSLIEVDVKVSKIDFNDRNAYLLAVIDQTEKMRAKRALERVSARFRQVFDTALVGITLTSDKGDIIEANDAFLKMVGHTRNDLKNSKLNWVEMTPPEYAHLDSKAGNEIVRTGFCEPYEKEYFRKDGSRVPILIHISPVPGEVGIMSCFILDLTELKRANLSIAGSEGNLKAIINSGNHGYLLLDKERRVLVFNKIMGEWTKALRGVEMKIGAKVSDYYRPETPSEYNEALNRAYKGVTSAFTTFYKDSKRWFRFQVTPIFNNGQIHSVCIYSTDVTAEKESAEVVKKNEEKFRSLVQNSSDITAILSSDAKIQYVSDSVAKILGYDKNDLIGKSALDFVPSADLAKVRKRWLHRLNHPNSPIKGLVHRIKNANGKWRYMETTGTNLLDNPTVNGVVINSRDITERQQTEHDLLESRQFIQQIANSTPNIIYLYDIKQKKTKYVNEAVTNLLNLTTAEILKNEPEIWQKLIYPEVRETDRKTVKRKYSATQKKGKLINEVEFRFKDKRGHWRWLLSQQVVFSTAKNGEPLQFVGTIEDITERRKMEDKLIRDAFYDDLTDLPNRNLFVQQLDKALLASREPEGNNLAVLFVDLDRFKIVNDSLGHTIGDKLLVAIAKRLKKCIRSTDMVARMGGDEFTVLVHNFLNFDDVVKIADKIQDELAQPFKLDRYEVYITPSIGIALSDNGYENAEDLLRDADTAMYRAKSQGRGRYEVFDRKMHTKVLELLKLEADLRRAMDRKEFQLHYHPIVSLETNKIIGCEALIRWNHPEKGLIYPKDFIGLAEETGLILRIDRWALYTAALQNKLWQMAGLPEVQISVNLSTHQLKQRNLTQVISKVLNETKLDPRFLRLELTESVVMENADLAIDILNEVRRMGVSLAVDDFGTGYSSLIYLKQLPIDTLKIDKSFIKDIIYDSESASIAKAIISLAHNLGLRVVAEGVENTEQLSFLRLQNCDSIQGFLFSTPLTAEQFAELLESQKTTS
ncbi:MAG: hypothetical protein OHK0017_11470 [Patescibacteria group bacterium]